MSAVERNETRVSRRVTRPPFEPFGRISWIGLLDDLELERFNEVSLAKRHPKADVLIWLPWQRNNILKWAVENCFSWQEKY